MNPDLEFFLERVFESVQPTAAKIGRVVVEPDYNVEPDEEDGPVLVEQFVSCLQEYGPSLDAFEPSDKYPVLAKYVRCITPHRDSIQGPWVEVAPPGNWI